MKRQEARVAESLQPFLKALQSSMSDHEQIQFDLRRDTLLKAFIDTINDDHSRQNFFQISVSIPLLLGEFQAGFYLYEMKTDRFLCVCDSENGLLEPPRVAKFVLPPDYREIRTFSGS